MVSTDFSGKDIAKVLYDHGWEPVDRTGSHIKLRYEHPENDDDVRVVTIPNYKRIDTDILQEISDDCGAESFKEWCEWIGRCK